MSPKEKFRNCLLDLGNYVHVIISTCWEQGYKIVDPFLVHVVIKALGDYNRDVLIQEFIKGSYLHWDKVLAKDETFFTNNLEDVFNYLSKERLAKVELFKKLILLKTIKGELALSVAAREHIWKLLHYMVKFSIRYLGETEMDLEDLDLEKMRKKWKIQ